MVSEGVYMDFEKSDVLKLTRQNTQCRFSNGVNDTDTPLDALDSNDLICNYTADFGVVVCTSLIAGYKF